jgi:hypothetical protein
MHDIKRLHHVAGPGRWLGALTPFERRQLPDLGSVWRTEPAPQGAMPRPADRR